MKKKETNFEELMKNVDYTRWLQALIPVMQPIIIFGAWLGFSMFDKKASAVSKLIAICEPIPTIDLNVPRPVVLASLYHSTDEALKILADVLEFLKDIDIPSAGEIIDDIKDELLPDPIDPGDILSAFRDCEVGYERDTPKLLQNKYSKGIYVNACLLKKGWGSKAILEIIREKLE